MSEKFTYKQVDEQQAAGYENPTVLVPRKDGRIVVGNREVINGEPYATFTEDDGTAAVKLAKEEAFSDQAQAHFANELALSANRSPEEWNPIGTNPEDEKDEAEAERILEELNEAVRSFRTQYADEIDTRLSRSRGYEQTLDECEALVRRFMYGDIPKQQFATHAQELLAPLQGALMQDGYSSENLRRSTRQLQGAVEESAHSASRNGNTPDELRHVLRKMEEATNEIDSRAGVIVRVDEEAVFTVRKIIQVLDELSQDSWGEETYASQLSSMLSHDSSGLRGMLEDQRRALLVMQSEIESMK